MKEFQAGDTSGDVDGPVGADPTLQACVAAASRAVVEGERQAAARAMGASDSPREDSVQSDSDGGDTYLPSFPRPPIACPPDSMQDLGGCHNS